MRLAFVTMNSTAWGGSEVLWSKAAALALDEGHEVLVSMYDFSDNLPEPLLLLQQKGAKFVFRRKFYPEFKKRLNKKLSNKLAPHGKKKTYHDYLYAFKADRIFFNLGGGDEIARDDTDMMVFIQQCKIPFFIFSHTISYVPENNNKLADNLSMSYELAQKSFFTSNMQIAMQEHMICNKIQNATILNHPVRVSQLESTTVPINGTYNMALIGNLLIRHKGQDVVLRVLANEEWKNRNVKVNIYGDGDDKDYLQRLVDYYGLGDKVVFKGYENDMETVWSENHILLIPTRKDSGPITMFEAMSFGKPIVGTRMGAIPDYVKDGVNGIICEPYSFESFSNAMESAWENKDKWEDWGKESLKIIKEQYDFTPEQTLLNYLTGTNSIA